jgi:hypothetical protein
MPQCSQHSGKKRKEGQYKCNFHSGLHGFHQSLWENAWELIDVGDNFIVHNPSQLIMHSHSLFLQLCRALPEINHCQLFHCVIIPETAMILADLWYNLSVKTSSEAHPVSYPVGKGCPFPGVQCSQGVMLITYPHVVVGSRMSKSYTPLPLVACMVVQGTLCFTSATLKVSRLPVIPW